MAAINCRAVAFDFGGVLSEWDQNVEAAPGIGMQAVLSRVDKGDDLRAQLQTLGIVSRR